MTRARKLIAMRAKTKQNKNCTAYLLLHSHEDCFFNIYIQKHSTVKYNFFLDYSLFGLHLHFFHLISTCGSENFGWEEKNNDRKLLIYRRYRHGIKAICNAVLLLLLPSRLLLLLFLLWLLPMSIVVCWFIHLLQWSLYVWFLMCVHCIRIFMLLKYKRPYLQWRLNDTSKYALFSLKSIQ